MDMFRMTQQFVTFPPSAVTTMPLENPPDHSQVHFILNFHWCWFSLILVAPILRAQWELIPFSRNGAENPFWMEKCPDLSLSSDLLHTACLSASHLVSTLGTIEGLRHSSCPPWPKLTYSTVCKCAAFRQCSSAASSRWPICSPTECFPCTYTSARIYSKSSASHTG